MNGYLCVVSGKAPEEIIDSLKKLGLQVVLTKECKSVDNPISYHPDIQMFPLSKNEVIISPEMYHVYKKELEHFGIKVIMGDNYLSKKYPGDIKYNVLLLDNMAIHSLNHTDTKIREILNKKKVDMINIKQGYAKCSVMKVTEKFIITSDKGIYDSLKNKDIDILLISKGHIDLEGYDYGFIGGATGSYSNKVLIAGSISSHPDKKIIYDELIKRNIDIIELKKGKMIDIGTIFIFEIKKEGEF